MRLPNALILAALCAAASTPRPAAAAESYDNCTGFVTSLPATITTQGVWCLKQDLASSLASGALIQIDANNVTLDCNAFKIGGLGAGPTTAAIGIRSDVGTANTTVRNCNLRGLRAGIWLQGSAGLVEDNRLEGITATGIRMEGDAGVVRRNRLLDIGFNNAMATGVYAYGSHDIADNLIVNVGGGGEYGSNYGIFMNGSNGLISGNQVRNVARPLNGASYGYWVSAAAGSRVSFVENAVMNDAGVFLTFGFRCGAGLGTFRANTSLGANYPATSCNDDGGNALR